MRVATGLMAIGLCWGQAPIAAPSIGKMLDTSGTLRTVYGMAGNFTVGPPEAVRVISAACSETVCLAKTANRIQSPKTSVLAPSGPALFGFDGPDAVVYFPAAKQFARWHQGRLLRLAWHVDGEVLALRGTEIAVRRDADVWVVRPDGTILDYLGEVAGPVLLLDGAAVLASEDALVLRRPAQDDVRFELSGIQGLSALGSEYVQVKTAAGSYALRTTPGREDLLLLPTLRGGRH